MNLAYRNKFDLRGSISSIRKYLDMLFFACIILSIYSGFVYLTKIPEISPDGFVVKIAYLIYRYILYVYLFIAVFKIIVEFFEDKKRAIILFLLLVVAFVHGRYSQYSLIDFCQDIVMAVAANRINFKKIAILFWGEEAILTIGTILLALLGILPNEKVEGVRSFSCLGFGSHNVLMIMVFFNSMIVLYLLRERITLVKDSLIIIFISFIFYKITDSRTSFMVICLCVVGLIIISVMNKKCNIEKKNSIYRKMSFMSISIPVICSVISYIGMIMWNYLARDLVVEDMWQINGYTLWDNTMTNRFRDATINFAANGFELPWENMALKQIRQSELFRFNWLFGGGYCSKDFDNIYMCAFITAGIIGSVLLLAYMTYLAYRAYKTNDIIMAWIFVCISVFAIMEGLKYFEYNPFLIIIFSDWELKSQSCEN